MALAVTLFISFKDAKNKPSSLPLRIPTGFTLAQYTEFAEDALQVIANVSIARITGASLNFGLDLSTAALTNVAGNVLANVTSKLMLGYNSAVAGFKALFKIPTYDEDNLTVDGTDQPDVVDVGVAALLAGIEDGYDLTTGGVMAPTDKYGNDLDVSRFQREIHVHRRAA